MFGPHVPPELEGLIDSFRQDSVDARRALWHARVACSLPAGFHGYLQQLASPSVSASVMRDAFAQLAIVVSPELIEEGMVLWGAKAPELAEIPIWLKARD